MKGGFLSSDNEFVTTSMKNMVKIMFLPSLTLILSSILSHPPQPAFPQPTHTAPHQLLQLATSPFSLYPPPFVAGMLAFPPLQKLLLRHITSSKHTLAQNLEADSQETRTEARYSC